MEEDKDIWDKLDEHEKRISENTKDITDLKVDNASQKTTVNSLKESIDKLTTTMDKLAEKLNDYMVSDSNKENDNWKWVVGIILIPIIYMFIKYILKI